MTESYMYPNAYFRVTDPKVLNVAGFEIPQGHWSRFWEYRFAMDYAQPNTICADMGAGWHYRPLHDYLAQHTGFCYAVDHHKEILDLPPMTNGAFVVADFSKPITEIEEKSLDRIFCVSVLEELINYQDALSEFKRLLKDDGLIVLTCDMPYDETKPAHDKYKGVRLEDLEKATEAVGLRYTGSVNRVKYDDLLHNDDFNLCVWRCTLQKIK